MLSKNFTRSEFKCNCGNCENDTVDAELLEALQALRDFIGKPIVITSGNRCLTYNRSIGSADTSQHVKGRAVDIQVNGVSPSVIQGYLLSTYPDKFGIGCYPAFTHLDTRTKKARW